MSVAGRSAEASSGDRASEGCSASPSATPPRLLIGVGEVLHTRLRPVHHAFRYPTFFVLLPMRHWRHQPAQDLPRNRFGLISFHDRDHGDGRADCLLWLDDLLDREGIHDADGEVWLHCLPRVLGYAFKPVSFWYCHRADGSLRAVVAEVNNTFGERHIYVLDAAGRALRWGQEMCARKVFHVSPFCAVAGGYRFRFFRNDLGHGTTQVPRTVARVDHDDAQGPLLQTSVSGRLQALTTQSLRSTFWRMPLLTLGVLLRIHWQAWRLWRQQVPFFRKPEPPPVAVSHGSPVSAAVRP